MDDALALDFIVRTVLKNPGRIRPQGVDRLRRAGAPLAAALADRVERYPRYRSEGHRS